MPMTAGLAKTELVDKEGFATQQWQIFFRDFDAVLAQVPVRERVIQMPPEGTPPQHATIPTTPLGVNLASGLYRVSAYLRVTKPAVTSSSILLKISWWDGGINHLLTLIPALTGNTTSTVGGGTAIVRVDQETDISFATDYVSVAPDEMEYTVSLVLEAIGGQ